MNQDKANLNSENTDSPKPLTTCLTEVYDSIKVLSEYDREKVLIAVGLLFDMTLVRQN